MPNDTVKDGKMDELDDTERDLQTEAEQATDRAEEQVETDISTLLEQVQNLTDERDQLRDQVLRAMADFQNFKRRNQQEMNLFRQFATENFVRDLLPVLDNFERSLTHIQSGATVEKVVEGISAVERQLRKVLEAQNVTRIRSIGEHFDPALHEALGTDHGSDKPEDTITAEIEPGYKMGEKVIRPARVRIAKRGG